MTRPIRNPDARAAQGHPAGYVSRVLANGIDILLVYVAFIATLWFLQTTLGLLGVRPTSDTIVPPVWVTVTVLPVMYGIYATYGWATSGRTVGKEILGLRVVGLDGQLLSGGRAFRRAIWCGIVGAIGLLLVLVNKRNAALQDLLVKSAVIYDWRELGVLQNRVADQPAGATLEDAVA